MIDWDYLALVSIFPVTAVTGAAVLMWIIRDDWRHPPSSKTDSK